MFKTEIIIRTDVSSKIGTGHIVRTLELLKLLKKYFKITIVSKYNAIFLWKVKKYKILKYSNKLMKNFYKSNSNLIFFFDLNNNFVSASEKKIINQIKKKYKTIFFVDDLYKPLKKQLNIAPYQLSYETYKKYSNILYGPKYSIFRDNLIKVYKKNYKKINVITICMGGSDPKNLTLKILNKIKDIRLNKKLKIRIILGKLFEKKKLLKIKKIIKKNNNLKLYINPKNIYKLFAESKFSIINNGNIKYEMCALKTPFILVSNDIKTHKFSKFFAKFFNCFFINNKKKQIKKIDKLIRIASKNEKKLFFYSKNNFAKINLYSKNKIIDRIINLKQKRI